MKNYKALLNIVYTNGVVAHCSMIVNNFEHVHSRIEREFGGHDDIHIYGFTIDMSDCNVVDTFSYNYAV